jgi:hypothetical protein
MAIFFPRIAPVAAAVVLSISATAAQAVVINFQDYVAGTGPMFGVSNAKTITITTGGYDVVFGGGVDLGPNATNMPATASVVYGTADFANTNGYSGYTNPITIQFFNATTHAKASVNNFFMDLYNGNTAPVDYTVQDNLGHGAVFNLADNMSSGQHTFGFASAGDSFTVSAGPAVNGCCEWDFELNNVGFNELLPPGSDNGHPISPVPEPTTNAMLLAGLGLIGFVTYRRRKDDFSDMHMAA